TADPGVDGVHAPRRLERRVEVAEGHGKDVLEGPAEPTLRVGLGLRVLVDGVGDEGVRRLEQRRAPAAEEDDRLPVDLPGQRARSEEAGAGILHPGAELVEGALEVGTLDDLHGFHYGDAAPGTSMQPSSAELRFPF